MTYRVPFLSVSGPDGTDQLQAWGSRLVGVKVVTRWVDHSDECTFIFRNGVPYMTAPPENTPFTVSFGWSQSSATLAGIYYFQREHLSGHPKRGEQVEYICRSGLMAGLDQAQSQHFNADNGNTTLGDVFRNLFAGAGMAVAVAPTIAGLPVPGGHLVQWNQSAIDFATDLAADVGGIVKPMGGQILVLDRLAGLTVSGQTLAAWSIVHDPSYEYDVEIEPRFAYQSVSANYFDQPTGRLKSQSSPDASGDGAKQGLPHPAPDQASAATLAQARANEWRRFTGTGMFTIPGEPNAVAGSKPACSGYPDPIDGIAWIAVEVTHDIVPDTGWITTVETETDPE